MYVPEAFAAKDADALIERLARAHAGILVTVDADGAPTATHLPILWNSETRIATGHIARANPQHKLSVGRGLIVLTGPQAYVSPSFYASKAEHGRVVPTWNYEAVHLSGTIEWFDNAARLEAVVRALSERHEEGRAAPWSLDDAPRDYVEKLLRGIVGMEMRVERVEAKRKLSQNKEGADFTGVMRGLAESGDAMARDVSAAMQDARALANEPDGN